MKRATKRPKSTRVKPLGPQPPGGIRHPARPQPDLPIARPPDAESGHNLFLQLERMAALIAAIDERTKRLEAAVVPPRSFGQRVKDAVGM